MPRVGLSAIVIWMLLVHILECIRECEGGLAMVTTLYTKASPLVMSLRMIRQRR